jgi:hypothetical protein
MFRKLDLYPSSGEEREATTLLDPSERAKLLIVYKRRKIASIFFSSHEK